MHLITITTMTWYNIWLVGDCNVAVSLVLVACLLHGWWLCWDLCRSCRLHPMLCNDHAFGFNLLAFLVYIYLLKLKKLIIISVISVEITLGCVRITQVFFLFQGKAKL